MLKRLSILAFALLFAVGVTVQMVPHAASAMAMNGDRSAPCEMAPVDGARTPSAPADDLPCKGMMPGCIGSVGCIVVIDLPSPIVPAAPLHRVFAAWSGNGSDLAGRSVEPELSPPIRKA